MNSWRGRVGRQEVKRDRKDCDKIEQLEVLIIIYGERVVRTDPSISSCAYSKSEDIDYSFRVKKSQCPLKWMQV